MIHGTTESPIASDDRHAALRLLARVLEREAHVLVDEARTLPSHLHNALALDPDEEGPIEALLASAREALAGRPWLRLANRPPPPTAPSSVLRVLDHGATVRTVGWSPDGSRLASAGDDGSVCLWDPGKGTEEARLWGHEGSVRALAWSPDGAMFASGGADGRVVVWDTDARAPALILQAQGDGVEVLTWPQRLGVVAGGYESGVVRLWSIASGTVVAVLGEGGDAVSGLGFSPDDAWLASASNDGPLLLWDTTSWSRRVQASETWGLVAWSQRGVLASTSRASSELFAYVQSEVNTMITAWDIGDEGDARPVVGLAYLVRSLAFSPDGALVACGGSLNQVNLKRTDSQLFEAGSLWVMRGHTGEVRTVSFSPDGEIVASGGDTTVRLWDVAAATGQQEWSVPLGHWGGSVEAVAISPDGGTVASGGDDEDDRLILWSADEGTTRTEISAMSDGIYGLAFSPDGGSLASAGLFRIDVRDLADREHRQRLWSEALDVAWSPDGKILSSAGVDGTVTLWTATSEEPVARLAGHEDGVVCLAWSPDGALLASGSKDRTVRVWDPYGRRCLSVLEGHEKWLRALAWSPSGSLLASGSNDRSVRLWEPKSGLLAVVLGGHHRAVSALAWGPDETLLVSGDDAGTVRIWEWGRRRVPAQAQCLSGIAALWMSRDGRLLRAVDDGRAAANRPIPFLFELLLEGEPAAGGARES